MLMAQYIAEQVMLRSVSVRNLPQLEALVRKVIRRDVPQGSAIREPGHMIRALFIADDSALQHGDPDCGVPDPTPWVTPLVILLIALPLLRAFAQHVVPITRAVIVCLVPPPTGCLTILRFLISLDRGVSDGVLSYVNQLQGLEHLEITIECDEGTDYEFAAKSFETLDALELPGVKRFSWYSDFMGGADANYLAKCRFHRSCNVCINRFDYDSDVSASLAPFFLAHTFTSAILHLTEDTLVGLASHIVAIDSVKLMFDPPPPELLHCGRLPAQLKINIQMYRNGADEDDAEDELARFWEFLRAIPPLSERGYRVTELSVIVRASLLNPFKYTGREFRWSDVIKERCADFVEQLATEATRLYKEGLVIVDGPGRNVMQRAG
jgi:hypothetical protein